MNEPTCASGVDLLIDYLEGVVADDVRVAIEAHVSGCARCTAFIESYVAAPAIARRATAAAMPPELQASLLAALRRQRDSR